MYYSEALKIITADDSMDLLRNTAGSFLQVDAESQMRIRRNLAVAALRKAAASPAFEADDLLAAWHGRGTQGQKVSMLGAAGGPRMQLSALAVSMSLDSFTKIKEMMDTMVADLKVEWGGPSTLSLIKVKGSPRDPDCACIDYIKRGEHPAPRQVVHFWGGVLSLACICKHRCTELHGAPRSPK